ncbi:MAG: hypothetical protein ACP5NS_00225 [Candidatus Pacearchaeota archaeon]
MEEREHSGLVDIIPGYSVMELLYRVTDESRAPRVISDYDDLAVERLILAGGLFMAGSVVALGSYRFLPMLNC